MNSLICCDAITFDENGKTVERKFNGGRLVGALILVAAGAFAGYVVG